MSIPQTAGNQSESILQLGASISIDVGHRAKAFGSANGVFDDDAKMNEAMKNERSEFLQVAPYQRRDERVEQANGFTDKTVQTRVGALSLRGPQVRGLPVDLVGFYPQSLEKGLRSERALKQAIAQMYITGVSTRKVAQITQELCGFGSTERDQTPNESRLALSQLQNVEKEMIYREYFHRKVEALMEEADLRPNGHRPWDIQVHDERLYNRILVQGPLGLGESYVEGWWDCAQVDELICKILQTKINRRVHSWSQYFAIWRAWVFNLQNPSRAFQVGQFHYDLGNELYQCMLDRRMMYSCAYWSEALTLDEAQESKLDLVCRKLGLEKGMRLLDIGCGWGGMLHFAAERYGVEGVGVTVSREQAEYARQLCSKWPVEIRLQDYRSLDEKFDRIVSIGMFEHVGVKNYSQFMRVARRCLPNDGLLLLHTIGRRRSSHKMDSWLERYIFPNAVLPSARQISAAAEELFVLEDWHNFGADYDKTLMQWFANFDRGWSQLKGQYDERFYRMWKYYLLCCAGSFRARFNQLWQIVFSPEGVSGGYRMLR